MICPECRDGKPRNCTNRAGIDEETGSWIPCENYDRASLDQSSDG